MTQGGPSRAVVIGGGITGLVAAYRLQQAGIRVTLLEKTARVGGCIRTVKQDGFLMEDGPDSFLARKRAARMLCEEIGLKLQETLPQPHRAYILRRGSLIPLPDGFSGLVPSKLGPLLKTPLLSARGKARLLMDLVIPRRRREEDESVASFFRRRVGREAYEELIEPLVGGIGGGDPEELSLMAAFPQLQEAERKRGSLLRALKRQSVGQRAFLGIEGGMETLPRALADRLMDVRCNAAVTWIERVGDAHYRVILTSGTALEASRVVVAVPANAATSMLESLDESLAADLLAYRYGSVDVVHLAYEAGDLSRPLDGYGYIVPSSAGQRIVACTWSSAKFPRRAPKGQVLFRLFLQCSPRDDPDSGENSRAISIARRGIQRTLGFSAPPVFGRAHRWNEVMPRYTLGHLDRLAQVRKRLRSHPGLILCGALFGGVGISDRVENAEHACSKIIELDGKAGIHRREVAWPN